MSDLSLHIDDAISPPDDESHFRDYFALLKPRVMSLVVFSGFAGMWIAPGMADIHPLILATALLSLAVGAGAAGAVNMWFDRDIDQLMTRTSTRPVAAGRIQPAEALTFAVILSVLSVMMMGLAVNWTAAGILAFANLFYGVIYTMWLKRSTPQNIVIGGAAGAFPPMIGWAAVTGNITLDSFVLFLIIFLWTPPHFWALSLFAGKDYARAGIPMMNVVRGERATKIQMLAYTLVLLPVTLAPVVTGLLSVFYGIAACILSGFFVYSAVRVLCEKDGEYVQARAMFGYSVFYLFAIFLSMILLS